MSVVSVAVSSVGLSGAGGAGVLAVDVSEAGGGATETDVSGSNLDGATISILASEAVSGGVSSNAVGGDLDAGSASVVVVSVGTDRAVVTVTLAVEAVVETLFTTSVVALRSVSGFARVTRGGVLALGAVGNTEVTLVIGGLDRALLAVSAALGVAGVAVGGTGSARGISLVISSDTLGALDGSSIVGRASSAASGSSIGAANGTGLVLDVAGRLLQLKPLRVFVARIASIDSSGDRGSLLENLGAAIGILDASNFAVLVGNGVVLVLGSGGVVSVSATGGADALNDLSRAVTDGGVTSSTGTHFAVGSVKVVTANALGASSN